MRLASAGTRAGSTQRGRLAGRGRSARGPPACCVDHFLPTIGPRSPLARVDPLVRPTLDNGRTLSPVGGGENIQPRTFRERGRRVLRACAAQPRLNGKDRLGPEESDDTAGQCSAGSGSSEPITSMLARSKRRVTFPDTYFSRRVSRRARRETAVRPSNRRCLAGSGHDGFVHMRQSPSCCPAEGRFRHPPRACRALRARGVGRPQPAVPRRVGVQAWPRGTTTYRNSVLRRRPTRPTRSPRGLWMPIFAPT